MKNTHISTKLSLALAFALVLDIIIVLSLSMDSPLKDSLSDLTLLLGFVGLILAVIGLIKKKNRLGVILVITHSLLATFLIWFPTLFFVIGLFQGI